MSVTGSILDISKVFCLFCLPADDSEEETEESEDEEEEGGKNQLDEALVAEVTQLTERRKLFLLTKVNFFSPLLVHQLFSHSFMYMGCFFIISIVIREECYMAASDS